MFRLIIAASALGLVAASSPAVTTDPGSSVTVPVTRTALAAENPQTPRVLAISVDALSPAAIRKLGRGGAPNLYRLIRQGAATLNARTDHELTLTLPNHTSMVTGRRIDPRRSGHGVSYNDDRAGTVQGAAGGPVYSVFDQVAASGGSSAVFSTKTKFSIFRRSWPESVDRLVVREEQDGSLMRAARADLLKRGRSFTFVHFGRVDQVGHSRGFQSTAALRAVREVDGLVGGLLRAIDRNSKLAGTVLILTADHGGFGEGHGDATSLANYRIPFLVWGEGISRADLYALSPDYRSPGRRRVSYAGPQPIRNGDLANLTAGLLGLPSVPGSQFGVQQRLEVR